MNPQLQGLYFVGTLAGHRQISGIAKNTGKPYTMTFLGIRVTREDGYGTLTDQLVELRISDRLIDKGVLQKIDSFQDKTVAVSCYVTAYQSNGKAQYDINLSNDDENIVLFEKAASVKAA